ncbi:response regulator [Cognatilysobacter bugurensis]|uniref:Response regulatory domain-containing protein n=1 Tax=Cognatilysobacter bugurensis TaxID=543356 RepID=A0A918T0X9_9GAMM|nr:response regulator [Lysobacter bugurensis]GHA83457.1 hypothetical protein GCM10007067_21970 [Lysobacter bugurensis]
MSGRTLLVIEDDADIRDTIRAVFELDGYAVETAANGAEGLEKIAVMGRPCVILLDLMMPVMDGWGFLERLRAHADPDIASASVTVVSGVADHEEAATLRSRFGCGMVHKPADIAGLMRIVHDRCGPG